jgi:hypothetical protein
MVCKDFEGYGRGIFERNPICLEKQKYHKNFRLDSQYKPRVLPEHLCALSFERYNYIQGREKKIALFIKQHKFTH